MFAATSTTDENARQKRKRRILARFSATDESQSQSQRERERERETKIIEAFYVTCGVLMTEREKISLFSRAAAE